MGGEGRIEDIKKTLVLLSILVFIVSTLVLVSVQGKQRPIKVYRLDKGMLGKKVQIFGQVLWQREKKGVTFGEISTGQGRIKFFLPCQEKLSGNEFSGTVKEYKGELELVLDGCS